MKQKLLIVGAGQYAQVVAETAEKIGQWSGISFLDDNRTGVYILDKCGNFEQYTEQYEYAYPAFGNNELRMVWLIKLEHAGFQVPIFIHPAAYVSPSAVIGAGSVVLPGAVIHTAVRIGSGCIVNIGALIDHDTVLEDGVHVSAGAVIKARCTIGAKIKVEAGSMIKEETCLRGDCNEIQKQKRGGDCNV